MLPVVVAAQDIAAGAKITESMVELKALPEATVIQNAATSATQVVGQTLRYAVAKGQEFNQKEPAKGQALSFQIPHGLRAFTIQVSVNNTPARLIAAIVTEKGVARPPFEQSLKELAHAAVSAPA